MAFINEKLTVEQRKEFMKRGIKKPTSDMRLFQFIVQLTRREICVFGR